MNTHFNINTFHQDLFDVSFSNLPTVDNLKDLSIYDRFVKSIVIPDYNIQEIISYGPDGFQIRHPVGPRPNTDLSQLQIDFKLSEDMSNYLYLFDWMQRIRYIDKYSLDDLFRKYTIKSININLRDNQKRSIATLSFINCFLLTLSNLSLEQGSAEETIFTTSYSYEELKYEQLSILN